MKDCAATIAELREWLLEQSVTSDNLAGFIEALARRLCESGVPIERLTTGINTRHPEVSIYGARWSPSQGTQIGLVSYDMVEQEKPQRSPFYDLIEKVVPEVRCRLLDGQPTPYPMVNRLRAEGITDYLALPLGEERISYATCAPDGFSDENLSILRGIGPVLALQLDRASCQHALRSLLQVYLGHDAARRVLGGQIRRGTGVEDRYVLWFCDIRGFTELSDRKPRREVVALLDEIFERVGGAIADQGGEVLKFIGDAVLASFAIGGDAQEAARRALAAARQALTALDAWNAEHPNRCMSIGVALHIGDVLYGNIGARERLDFTVIGAAVNEVCRIESLCKPTGVRLLCSEDFADLIGREHLKDLGPYPLKGVTRLVRIFGGE